MLAGIVSGVSIKAEILYNSDNCEFELGEFLSVAQIVDNDSLGGFPQSHMEESKVPDIVELLLGSVGFDSDGGFPVVPMGKSLAQC